MWSNNFVGTLSFEIRLIASAIGAPNKKLLREHSYQFLKTIKSFLASLRMIKYNKPMKSFACDICVAEWEWCKHGKAYCWKFLHTYLHLFFIKHLISLPFSFMLLLDFDFQFPLQESKIFLKPHLSQRVTS